MTARGHGWLNPSLDQHSEKPRECLPSAHCRLQWAHSLAAARAGHRSLLRLGAAELPREDPGAIQH
eukprot:7097213-Pyramimonas_sp.AAC.1